MDSRVLSIVFTGALVTASLAASVQAPSAAAPAGAAADTAPVSPPAAPEVQSPAVSLWALRGLTQTVSAEPMGEGRLTIGFSTTWYSQDADAPLEEADVLTGIMALCYGLNPFVDIFGTATGFGMLADSSDFGKGSFSVGLRGILPMAQRSPLRLGVQLGLISGTCLRKINQNSFDGTYPAYRTNSDGYDYFETEMSYDFVGKFIESLTFGNDSLGLKVHFNQGAALMLQAGNRQLLLLGIGIQGAVHPKVVLGLELNSRTNANDIAISTDPLWLTPSFLFRTPYNFNALLGIDVSLSGERTGTASRALEPFRLFGSFMYSLDVLAAKRRADREKAMSEKAAGEQKIKKAEERSELIASLVRVDSSARANALDSLKRTNAMMTKKAEEDSLQIAELKRKLQEERSKRSDAEKQLLSKGMLLLDAVYFNSGKARISINSFPYLNIIGKMLIKYPKLQIEVSGHTDNVGKYDRNIVLSQARAEAVRRYLIQVAPDLLPRISARGYGPTQPKATNLTKQGREVNRRTELQVLNKEALREYN